MIRHGGILADRTPRVADLFGNPHQLARLFAVRHTAVTRDELSAELAAIFGDGPGALIEASRALPIRYDSLRKMLAGKRPVPDWVPTRLADMKRPNGSPS